VGELGSEPNERSAEAIEIRSIGATYRSDEFGNPTATTGSSTQPYRFTGEPRDGTGLSYLRARYYDPSIGRFMSRDPYPGSMARCQTLNRYSYALNNPATLVDPSGHNPTRLPPERTRVPYDIPLIGGCDAFHLGQGIGISRMVYFSKPWPRSWKLEVVALLASSRARPSSRELLTWAPALPKCEKRVTATRPFSSNRSMLCWS
jgi:RHS repeat-associated protein